MDPGESRTPNISKKQQPLAPEMVFRTLPAALRLSAAEKQTLKEFASELSVRVGYGKTFTCLISDDRELRQLNRTFLRHDYATDVLSFPATGEELGEIAISIERAAAQAAEFGHSRIEEVRVLMLHGLLHLAGFDHERDTGRMARVERKWRSDLGLPASLTERAARAEARR